MAKNIVGESERVTAMISEYLRRRESQTPGEREANKILTAGRVGAEEGMQPYVKPRVDQVVSSRTQGQQPPKQAQNDRAISQNKKQEKKAAKKGKTVDVSRLHEAERMGLFSTKRGDCDCEARKHALINNCLNCGKIVCEKEGEGLCRFCGVFFVMREGGQGSETGSVDMEGISEAERKANEFRDRLVEYDRTAAKRTAVIDDQSDYFRIEGDQWLSKEVSCSNS